MDADAAQSGKLPSEILTDDGLTELVSGRLTINDVEVRRAEFVELLPQSGAVTVDLGGVEAIDAAGLQLLISMKASAVRRGVGLHFRLPVPGGAEPGAVMPVLAAAGLCEAELRSGRPMFRDDTWLVEG